MIARRKILGCLLALPLLTRDRRARAKVIPMGPFRRPSAPAYSPDFTTMVLSTSQFKSPEGRAEFVDMFKEEGIDRVERWGWELHNEKKECLRSVYVAQNPVFSVTAQDVLRVFEAPEHGADFNIIVLRFWTVP